MATVDKMPMLAEGYEKLQTEVRHLKTVERPSVIEAIEAVRGHALEVASLQDYYSAS